MDAFVNKPNNPQGFDLYANESNRGNIPQRNDPNIINSFSIDRLAKPPTGFFQAGIYNERKELFEALKNNLAELNAKGTSPDLTDDEINVIKRVPNSKMAYINKLFKTGWNQGVNQCDLNFLDRIWMSDNDKSTLKKIFSKFYNPNKNNDAFTSMPTSRYGAKYGCKNGNIQGVYYNPGTYNLTSEQPESKCMCPTEKIVDEIKTVAENTQNIVQGYLSKYQIHEDDAILSPYMSNPYLMKLIKWSRETAMSGEIDVQKLITVTEAFHRLDKVRQGSYLMSLVDPFRYTTSVRIPSPIPVPTAAFSLRRNINISTNGGGNVAFSYSPYALFNTANTTFHINNNVALTGAGSSNFFVGIDIGQTPIAAFYTRYRLVSAGIRVTFTTSSLTSTGFAALSTDFDVVTAIAVGTVNVNCAKYGDYSLIENGFYKQMCSVNNGNTISLNYLPVDSSMQDFWNLNNYPNGFTFNGYITGAPASTIVARVDIVANYEAFINNAYADYLQTDYPDPDDDFDECQAFVNKCNKDRCADPDGMRQRLPERRKFPTIEDIPGIPQQPIPFAPASNGSSIIDDIKQIGVDMIGGYIKNKLKDKGIVDRIGIIDKIGDLFSPDAKSYIPAGTPLAPPSTPVPVNKKDDIYKVPKNYLHGFSMPDKHKKPTFDTGTSFGAALTGILPAIISMIPK